MKQLILASQSPRRSEILKKAGYQFVSLPVYVSEIPNKNLSIDEQILDIAKRKAEEAVRVAHDKGLDFSDKILMSADTMVCIEGKTLGKPDNEQIAFEYLSLLSGKTHEVKTAVYIIDLHSMESLSHIETSQVIFKNLSAQDINAYILTKEPIDKAGAYAIQGEGSKLVQELRGDFTNVVGLPLQAVENLFTLKSWKFLKAQVDL